MIVVTVRTTDSHWELSGSVGETLQLPRARSSERPFVIGTVGTRRAVKVKGNLTARFAGALAELQQPIMLVDVRRTGMGGNGAWGPQEFATIIPEHLRAAGVQEYSFHHVPLLAPSRRLLDAWKRAVKAHDNLSEDDIGIAVQKVLHGAEPSGAAWKHWEVFRSAYSREMSRSDAILAGRAFVEAAREKGGLAIFLCAEERRHDFDACSREEQDACYCHRFTLAKAIARSIEEDFEDAEIRRVDVAVGEPLKHTALVSRS